MNYAPADVGVPDLSGELVAGKYRVGRLVGSGGMGTVWLGQHTQLGTRVAIKFIGRSSPSAPTRGVASRSRRAPRRASTRSTR